MINTKLQEGRSMIEMLAVLVIVGILTIGAYAGISQGMAKYRASRVQSEILEIATNFDDLYAFMRGRPTSFTTATLCENDVFPNGCTNNKQNDNLFTTKYTLNVDSYGNLTVSTGNVPLDICLDLSHQDWLGGTSVCTSEGTSTSLQKLSVVFP